MTEIVVNYSDAVSLSTVRIGLVCKKCKHTWAVYLTSSGNIPFGGDVCSNCERIKQQELKAKEASNVHL